MSDEVLRAETRHQFEPTAVWPVATRPRTVVCAACGVECASRYATWLCCDSLAHMTTQPFHNLGRVLAHVFALWWWWPEQWQAGLVFVLFGLLVLLPVTIKEIQSRRKSYNLAANPG